MKLLLSIALLFCYNLGNASGCYSTETVELDKGDGPLRNFKTNDQDGLGTCYANTASAMLTAALKDNPDVSYLQLALLAKTNNNTFASKNLNGGTACETIESAIRYGSICPKKYFTLENLFHQDRADRFWKQDAIIDQLHEFYKLFDPSSNINKRNAYKYLGDVIDQSKQSCEHFKYENISTVLLAEGNDLNGLISNSEAKLSLKNKELLEINEARDELQKILNDSIEKYKSDKKTGASKIEDLQKANETLLNQIDEEEKKRPILKSKKEKKLATINDLKERISQNNEKIKKINDDLDKSIDYQNDLNEKIKNFNTLIPALEMETSKLQKDIETNKEEFERGFSLTEDNEVILSSEMMQYLQNEYSDNIKKIADRKPRGASAQDFNEVYSKMQSEFKFNNVDLLEYNNIGFMQEDQSLENYNSCYYNTTMLTLNDDEVTCGLTNNELKSIGDLPWQVSRILDSYFKNKHNKPSEDVDRVLNGLRGQIHELTVNSDANWQVDFYKRMLGSRCNARNSIKFSEDLSKLSSGSICSFNDFGYKASISSKRKIIRGFAKKSLLTNKQPISLDVCSSLFHKTDLDLTKDDCNKDDKFGNHAITIIGQKCVNGKQYYKIMNSWGSECSSTSPYLEDCKNGRSWISEDNLMPQMFRLGSINTKYIGELEKK